MCLSGLFNQKEAEGPGYHIQQVSHMDLFSPVCSLSTLIAKWATKLFLGHMMKLGGLCIGLRGPEILPCAKLALFCFPKLNAS